MKLSLKRLFFFGTKLSALETIYYYIILQLCLSSVQRRIKIEPNTYLVYLMAYNIQTKTVRKMN